MQTLVVFFVLHQQMAALPRQISEHTRQYHGFNIRIPIVGGVILHMDITQTVAMERNLLVAESAGSLNCRFKVTADIEKVLGVNAIARLARVDRQHGNAFTRKQAQ